VVDAQVVAVVAAQSAADTTPANENTATRASTNTEMAIFFIFCLFLLSLLLLFAMQSLFTHCVGCTLLGALQDDHCKHIVLLSSVTNHRDDNTYTLSIVIAKAFFNNGRDAPVNTPPCLLWAQTAFLPYGHTRSV
jgi:hypothetical protein